jgi:hypothetical protein
MIFFVLVHEGQLESFGSMFLNFCATEKIVKFIREFLIKWLISKV